MRPIQKIINMAALTTNGIALSQAPVSGSPVTLNGSLVSGGVATPTYPAKVTIGSSDNISATVFTIYGLDDTTGQRTTETITGPNNSTVTTTTIFRSVNYILATGGTYTTERSVVGTAAVGIGAGDWWPLDIYTPNQVVAVSANLLGAATATYTVEYTNENPFDTTITPLEQPFPAPELVAATTDITAQTQALIRAIRFNIASGAGQLRATVTQQSTA